ncbi:MULTISPECIES: DUF1338 domain-containing protein [unclassified Sphingobacterium]|uniref:DUF1338 domain-containing protein n=1 Tax=unclassified Sphingobacterium TaxID=2609468 RepID=UPI0010521C4A|nr:MULTISPECIES: DUF1338 domain-containing protein [unclassified Sphingobacterium]MCS3556168.1 hypothetical protein [Sphingobacterium sp. JUb21]TCR08544.1 uncharacterized protein DUF1338 [Sphingobacterium sp. JUb20]
MNTHQEKPLTIFLNMLFDRYRKAVPAVKMITEALVEKEIIASQQEIINDHIAFRTMGVPHLGIASFEKIFLHHGYQKRDCYHFDRKKLNAYWYAPPSPEYPRVFISELLVDQLSDQAQRVIRKYTNQVDADPVDSIDLDDGNAIGEFFHQSLWDLPTKEDYLYLLEESEYAAWVIYNRYYLNHYTISVHDLKNGYNTLEDFNRFVESLGLKLNVEGGKIKTSPDGLLRQSSTMAQIHVVEFPGSGTMPIAGSYVEFSERLVYPEFKNLRTNEIKAKHRREGFEADNADKIFESTYLKQTNPNQNSQQ